ncbi:glycoside hydrolase family 16 protein [Aaosphaeria arxii CBS 175.79]|uniref:endo-1,3(4)-beta-glucanase n=1 Tax=Aaosphaeria arxii CBS 175.79 TaxID=1450172 RepID=A0A6A5XKY8_9PLEO|nr:glycoside hydrolase family 16 protein [Aaosphaeria arxii CBS 175.79]KAF2013802.1 glycoside hydrolase family 16 protein [Aaosphaeria arxii CBS 175.79]
MRDILPVLLLIEGLFSQGALGAYTLVDNFAGTSFLSGFTFFNEPDPTHGFVRYLSQSDATAQGLVKSTTSQFSMTVDSKNKAPDGRASVRLHSKKTYMKGLFVLDVEAMPTSTCGTWPSFWTWGSEKTWPEEGEIDIIEGVHTNTVNAMSLHTADGCSISGIGSAGTVNTKNCFINAPGQISNAGCGIGSSSPFSFGTGLNAIGGGVYAMEWTSTSIKIWFFPRDSIPVDLKNNIPNPASWGTPQANFEGGGCNYEKAFGRQRLVINTTFCGDWAAAVWTSNPTCKALAASCNDYVANNPTAFRNSTWTINYLKTFQQPYTNI